MAKSEKGWKLLISILIGGAGIASLHFQDGYPWLNCLLVGLVVAFLCFAMLAMAWHK